MFTRVGDFFRKTMMMDWFWLARHGGLGADAAHARGEGFRSDRAGFFTTSQAGSEGAGHRQARPCCRTRATSPPWRDGRARVLPGRRLHQRVHPKLREAGWKGYWIDAASALRMKRGRGDHPRPGQPRRDRPCAGQGRAKDYIGGNCTVSLMLMAMGGLFKAGWSSGSRR
jgi:aspartate-semialdehyde dehydrogenase